MLATLGSQPNSKPDANRKPVVFITGASSGIGEALAREYARRGYRVAMLARRIDRLERIKKELATLGSETLSIPCDVCKTHDLQDAVAQVVHAWGGIDVAIANAGFSVAGNFETLRLKDYRHQFETNVFGVLETLHATLGELKKSKGRFAAIGSMNGLIAIPSGSAYVMSKFAVRGLCHSLRYELRPSGVSVTHIAPGFVDTEIFRVDNQGVFQENEADLIPSWIKMPAPLAAKKIASAIQARRREAIVTAHGKALTFLHHWAPWLIRGILRIATPRIIEMNAPTPASQPPR